jgi:hypothetical protein
MMSDLDRDPPIEGTKSTLEDLMKAVEIADASGNADNETPAVEQDVPDATMADVSAEEHDMKRAAKGTDNLDVTKEVDASLSHDVNEKPPSTKKKESDLSFLKPELLLSAYEFKGSDEFNKKEGSNKRGQQAACLKSLNKALSDGYCEIDLQHLCGWYSDLRFCALLDDVMDDALHMWHYRLIVLNPHAMNLSAGNEMFK